jgi:hypothetical protein
MDRGTGRNNRDRGKEGGMDEGIFYGLFFGALLFNYHTKLKLEREGAKVERSNVREGILCGLCSYTLYQAITLASIPTAAKVVDTLLGIAALAACCFFFLKGRLGEKKDP